MQALCELLYMLFMSHLLVSLVFVLAHLVGTRHGRREPFVRGGRHASCSLTTKEG
jgi:hypothetical protein